MRRPLLAGFAAAVLCAGPAGAAERTLPSRVDADLEISGEWDLAGDLEVAPGATLRIAAGSVIRVALADASKSGHSAELTEIRVRGRIVVNGSDAAPVTIEGRARSRSEDCWWGIVLQGDRARAPDSSIRGARIRGARCGISVATGEPGIQRVLFADCDVGVACGDIDDARYTVLETVSSPQPRISECAFMRCRQGVFVETSAAPVIERSAFYRCRVALGNEHPSSLSSPLDGLGPVTSRCAFVRNDVAVCAGGAIEDSLFLDNGTAFSVSKHHGECASTIDRVAWRRNVLWGNTVASDGESDIGFENAFTDPKLLGARPDPVFAEFRFPLAGFELAPDSPIRGTALDGGDPGPSGRPGHGRRERVWAAKETAVARVLILGPPELVDEKALPKTAPAAAGERAGNAWWSAFDVPESGYLSRGALAASREMRRLAVAVSFRTAPPPMELEVNADGEVGVFAAGQPVAFPAGLRRAGTRGHRIPAPRHPAAVLWWQCRDAAGRLGVGTDVARTDSVWLTGVPAPATLAADAITYSGRQVGLRIRTPWHWEDARRAGVFRLRTAQGRVLDLGSDLSFVADGKGTLRYELADAADKAGAVFVIDGLRDAWGRTMPGQPLEVPAGPK